ncbi:MAG: 30S ribosomal protein S14 [Nanoarchaeota archaeon]|nr:30S ribosomal protein S14 [Nanoarchaeota archaeon]
MTAKNYKKVKAQLGAKPAKWAKYEKHNAPKSRKFGLGITRCEQCGTTRGHISQYGLNICRRCFRLNATKLGFKKLN